MSLIDEALKRAQAADPARRGDPGRDPLGLPGPTPVPLPDSRRTRRRGPLFAVAVAAGAALAFGGVWLARHRSVTQVAAAPRILPAPAAPQVLPTAPAVPPKREIAKSRDAPKPSHRPPAAVAAPSQRIVPSRESGAPREPSLTDRGVQENPAEPATPAPVRRNYVGEARLPGGVKIELGGIVYSEDHPVALLNGRIHRPGSSVEGFTVVEILENRVELQGTDRTIFITLK